jgi:predicted ATPase/DNA-binding CsgD family transcriptional regulator
LSVSENDRSARLPLDYGPLVGRLAEERRVVTLLDRNPLVTLTGTGGVGKTRLAVRVANSVAASMPGGACVVELAGLPPLGTTTVQQIYAAIGRATGSFNQQSGLDVLVDYLDEHRSLLVLDNCEHVAAPVREAVTALLAGVPGLRILATSRQPLHLHEAGEQVVDLAPLSTTDAIEAFLAYASAGGARLAAGGTGAATDPQARAELQQITTLVEALDRLPLALRLASAWLATTSLAELIHAVTADRWHTVVDLRPEAEPDGRHSALRRVDDWSWSLCTPAEQQVWQWISVFRNPAAQHELVAVCAGTGLERPAIARAVAGLRDKRILSAGIGRDRVPRLYLLETERQYGAEKLAAAGLLPAARAAHSSYYASLTTAAVADWMGPAEVEVLHGVHAQLDHIANAVDYRIADGELVGACTIVCDLTRSRSPFLCGGLSDVRDIADRVIRAFHRPPPAGEPAVGGPQEAVLLAATMATDGWVTVTQGFPDRAFELIAASHKLHEQWQLEPTPPLLFAEGGALALAYGDPAAVPLLDAARTAFDAPETGGDHQMATMMWAMAQGFTAAPDAEAAAAEYLRVAQGAQAPWNVSWAHWVGALAALGHHHLADARDQCRQALLLQDGIGDLWGLTWSLLVAAAIVTESLDADRPDQRQAQRAAWLAAAAEERRRLIGVRIAGLRPLARLHERVMARVGEVLDPRTLERQLDDGRRRHHQAVDYALDDRRPARQHPTGKLTRRQLEVARLMVRGLTYAQVAEALHLSERTVEGYAAELLHRLGLDKRTQLTQDVLDQASTGNGG